MCDKYHESQGGAGGNSGAPALQEAHGVDVLRAAVSSARAGRGRMLLVSGPAGIGKTRRLKAAADVARPSMVRLVARGTELERDMPFSAPLQLLEATVRRSPELLSGAAGMSRRLFSQCRRRDVRRVRRPAPAHPQPLPARGRPGGPAAAGSAGGRRARARCAVVALPGVPRTSARRSAGGPGRCSASVAPGGRGASARELTRTPGAMSCG